MIGFQSILLFLTFVVITHGRIVESNNSNVIVTRANEEFDGCSRDQKIESENHIIYKCVSKEQAEIAANSISEPGCESCSRTFPELL